MSLFLPLQTKILFYGDPASPPIPKGDCTRTLKELCWQDLCKRSLGKISEQDLQKRSLGKISAQVLARYLCEISRFVRACAVEMHMDMSQEQFDARIYRKNAEPEDCDTRFLRACAVEMHMDMPQEPFWMERCRTRLPQQPFCASLCSRNAHGHFTRAIFVRKFTGKMPNVHPGAIVLREPAQSKYTWTFHKSNFVWKFAKKLPDATDTPSIEHRAVKLTVRTPQCGHANWGNIQDAFCIHSIHSHTSQHIAKCILPFLLLHAEWQCPEFSSLKSKWCKLAATGPTRPKLVGPPTGPGRGIYSFEALLC